MSTNYFAQRTIEYITELTGDGIVSISQVNNDWHVTYETDNVYIYNTGMFLPDVLLQIYTIVNDPESLANFYK